VNYGSESSYATTTIVCRYGLPISKCLHLKTNTY
jgi:hypothetical protein